MNFDATAQNIAEVIDAILVAIDASKPLVPNISDEDAATSHAKPDASHPTSEPPRYASIHDRLAFALEEDSRRICRPAAAYVSTVE